MSMGQVRLSYGGAPPPPNDRGDKIGVISDNASRVNCRLWRGGGQRRG